MNKLFAITLVAALSVGTTAFATPWTVSDGNGGWKDNPNCGASCRETGIEDKAPEPTKPTPEPSKPEPTKPTPTPEPSKPEPTPTAPEPSKPSVTRDKGSDSAYVPTEEQHWTGTCYYEKETHRVFVHTAFGHNPEKAAKQCKERLRAMGEFK